ncbi:MAG: hypothetical protein AAF558_07720 [Verrucomicrobiota bacterium]
MPYPLKNIIAATWGIGGVVLILGQACWRLGIEAGNALNYSWTWVHYLACAGIVFFMAYSEGYRAFQKQFSPRVVSRGRTLLYQATWVQTVLAPLFCMGFFHATRKRMITSYIVTAGIILLVIGVRLMPHPWRGMVDLGVVVGLGWGIAAILAYTLVSIRNTEWHFPPDLPNHSHPAPLDTSS